MTKVAHLVVVGFDEIVSNKYLSCIQEAISAGAIDSYSIIDLESQREEIIKRIESLELKPENVFFLPDPQHIDEWANRADFEPIFRELIDKKSTIKVYIAAELKAHEGYLRYCVENGIPSLTEKPIFAPMKDGRFEPCLIESTMQYLINEAKNHSAKHSIMTLSRYHQIYNDIVMDSLRSKMIELQAPLTSFHFRHAGGVWNLHHEYELREDHPYKYGYGMIMHGGYHYVDLTVQFLSLNKLVFPNTSFIITLSSYVAYPADQNDRISKIFSEKFDDNRPEWSSIGENSCKYGETDVTTTFCMKDKQSGRTITLGTISLEQTTPSVRSWREFPEGVYNKNGRVSNVDFEAQLSTLHSVNVQCFDVPIRNIKEIERIDAFARISTRTNASLLPDEEYNTSETFSGLFHSDSNRKLMTKWLLDEEERSLLDNHLLTMRLTQAIATSIQQPGYPVSFDFI
ncbi:hypothetical protein [Lihuaxuella thermophila]|uniref:Oxidoreductase family, NAD-binding Rossmann fold n=1 Tax=Lihuaxuella thermophila TaxID=1173111 RepID=A0A1H8FQL3_9BACL|nr:hypothetical protein [Lihuaxuella thermophila]SEN33855.1 hypothetical protein SAMN05444955_10910 [Lihuaxuella thermophila]